VLGQKGLLSAEFVANFVAIMERSDVLRTDLKQIVWLPDMKRAFVRSDSVRGYYSLQKLAGAWSCSCPSNVFAKGPTLSDCKHINQVSELIIGKPWPESELDVIFLGS